jgi:hypothetical protein
VRLLVARWRGVLMGSLRVRGWHKRSDMFPTNWLISWVWLFECHLLLVAVRCVLFILIEVCGIMFIKVPSMIPNNIWFDIRIGFYSKILGFGICSCPLLSY